MIRDTLKTLSQSRIVRCRPPASADDIASAEHTLGVSFPRIYSEFLRICGVMDIYDMCVFGLGPSTTSLRQSTRSVVFQTQHHRGSPLLALPRHYIVIWHECHDDPDCIDTSRVSSDGDCPIMSFRSPPGSSDFRLSKPRQVASGFEEWLFQILERQTKNKALLDESMGDRLTKLGKIRPRTRSKKKAKKRTTGASMRRKKKA